MMWKSMWQFVAGVIAAAMLFAPSSAYPQQSEPSFSTNFDKVVQGNVTAVGAAGCNSGTGCVMILLGQGQASVGVSVTGTWTGTLQFEFLITGNLLSTGWTNITAVAVNGANSTPVTSTTANGNWTIDCGSVSAVRVRDSAAMTGTAVVVLDASSALGASKSATVQGQGTAGTASGGVLTVQGQVGMTPIITTAAGGSGSTTTNSESTNTTLTAATTIIASAASTRHYQVHNIGTNVTICRHGATVTTTAYDYALKGGAANDDGNGGYVENDDWAGTVSCMCFSGTCRIGYSAW